MYVCAELLDRRGDLVANAHDVSDIEARRDLHVDRLHTRPRGIDDMPPVDMRVLDDVVSGR